MTLRCIIGLVSFNTTRERERERAFWLKSLTLVGTRLSPGGPGGGLEATCRNTRLTEVKGRRRQVLRGLAFVVDRLFPGTPGKEPEVARE